MASMQLCKPKFGYGATASHSNFNEYKHQSYHKKQSSHAQTGWGGKPNQCSGPYGQPRGSHIGQTIYGLNEDESHNAWAKNSTNYYAQAQSVLPTPSIHVEEGQHVMETMNKHESHMGQDWAGSPPNCSSPINRADIAMQGHIAGKMEHGWGTKPTPCSSPMGSSQYGQSMYKKQEEKAFMHSNSSVESGWANKPIVSSGSDHFNHSASSLAMHKEEQMMGKMDHAWANKPTPLSGPILTNQFGESNISSSSNQFDHSLQTQTNHLGLAMHKQEHMMGKVDHSWSGKPTQFPSPVGTNQYGESMYNNKQEQKVYNYEGEGGWANKPTMYSGNQIDRSAQAMYKQKEHLGWVDKPTKCSSPTQAKHSNLAMYKEEHMMGKMDHGLANPPTRYSSPGQATHYGSTQSMHMEHGASNGYIGSDWANKSSKYLGPNQFDHSSHAMYKDQGQHGWGGKAHNGYGSSQINHSAHAMYGDENVDDIMDEILTKYPTHNVSGGNGNCGTKGSAYMMSQGQANYRKQGQGGWGGSAQYGGAQSMVWSEKKEKKEGYFANSKKEEYSNSYGADKFEMNKGGGIYGRIHSDSECDD